MAALLAATIVELRCGPKPGTHGLPRLSGGNEGLPQRIISLTPTNTEIVCALGLESKLVGVDTYSDYPESVKSIAKVGTFQDPNMEQIVALKPDLVLGGNKLQKDAIDKLRALGLNIVATEATDYEDVYKSIDLVGELTGAQQQADAVMADMKAKEKIVTGRRGESHGRQDRLLRAFLRRHGQLDGRARARSRTSSLGWPAERISPTACRPPG